MLLYSLLFLALSILLSFSTISVSGAPVSTNDNWKLVFDAGIDAPYNYSTSFTPKVWLYNQGKNLVPGATVTYTYFNVNDNSQIATGTATANGDGSYSGAALNMPNYAGKYINILFSVTAGSNTMIEQHVYFAGQSNAAHGALWKIEVFNTSIGPSWNGNNQQKIYMKLYSDAGTPYRNNFNTPTIAVWNSNGTAVQAATAMTYEEEGVYSYTISGYGNGEYYFQMYNQWNGQPTGGKNKYTKAYAGFYLEANNAQGDESAPEIITVARRPYFPVDDDYVNITLIAVDNLNIATGTLYYVINNQIVQTKPMNALTGIEYRATLDPYRLEDNVRYKVEVSDGTNTVSSDWYMYNVQDRRGEPNMSHSFLSHPAYWFGRSRQASFADRGGDTNYDGVYSTGEKDNVAYLAVNKDYQFFKDMTRIKVQTMILDSTGKPVQHLTNVKAWLSNNTTQPLGTRNREKVMTEVTGESGIYTATWEGSADVSGTTLVWNDDAKAIWGQYTSGEIYSVYIDVNNDGQPEENVTWLAYNFGDTFWGSAESGKTWGGHSDIETPGSTCGRTSCHDMTGGLTSRTTGDPACPDCHGVYKNANGGSWPVNSGTATNKDNIVYGNGTGHPRQNNTNATYCGDETCHNVAWGSGTAPLPAIDIPGYPTGTRINGTFRAEYPNPIQCGEHHNYTAAKIPVEEGHNRMVACKYCHGGSHDNNKLKDYSISIQGTNLSNVNRGTPGYIGAGGANGKAGDCYKDCHKTQVEHSITGMPGGATQNYAVPCDECHQNFDNASVHQENMFPYSDREWCGTCHQAQGTLSRHNTSNPLDPPRIPATQRHAQETGMRWNRTGDRPYWVENEQSCRFCHGRSYNEAYGMGRIETFMGTNIINGEINSTSYWCSSCHINTSTQNYNNMVNIYNNSFGVVPPEITGSTWKSNREGYDNHSEDGIDRLNPGTYSDDQCFKCHNGSLSPSVSMDEWEHQVSATTGELGESPTYIPPAPVNLASTQGNFWINYTWQAGAGNKTDSYNVSMNGAWTNGTSSTYSNNSVGAHGWSNISVWAYNNSGSGKLSISSASQNTQAVNGVPVQAPIGNKVITAGQSLTFTLSATDADSDTITYGTNATKGTLNPTTGVYSWTPTGSDVGTYLWSFSSSDSYGGVTSETITVTVNSMPTYIPPAPTNLASTHGNFWINYTWQAGAGNKTDSYNISVNGAWTNGTTSTFSNNSAGAHGWSNISVYAYNNSGSGKLSLSPASQNTQIANNVPVQAPIGNKVVTAGQLLTFTVSATDADSDTITYGTNATKGTLNPSTGVYSWTPGSGDVGVYTWSFSSGDGYGGVASETITVTVNAIPTYIPPTPTNLASTQNNFWINYTWQAGAENKTDSYNVSMNGAWTNGTSSTYSNNSVGAHGWSNLSVYAYNNSGSGTLNQIPVTGSTRVANNMPVQAPIGNKVITAGNLLTFTVSATDADSDPIIYTTNATKGTLNPTTGVYSWQTTGADSGTYVWSFCSSDNYGGITCETITVTVNQVPTYIPPAPANLASTQGNFWVNYTWQAGAGNVTNGYNVSVNGAWTNGTISPSSNNTAGPHGWSNISVWAYNTSGTGKLSLTAASQQTRVANNIPVQSPIGNKVVTAGNVLTFTVSATDADSDTITYGTNATKGTLVPSTGAYSWTTTPGDVGTYVWSFNSSDGYGGVASETITVTVTAELTYIVSGYVYDNYGAGLGGVLVMNGSKQNTTVASGYYSISGLVNGTYNFSYSKSGFNTGYQLVTISGSDVANANKTILDTTPPEQVTGLVNDTPTTTTINLSWTPTPDASYYQIFRDSDLAGTTQNVYWNDSGLAQDTSYQYRVRANDSYGNWGQNSTALDVRTASVGDTTPPASVKDLVNVSYAQDYINWTWTDPSDTDFSKVMVYMNGEYQNEVLKGEQYYNATVSPGTYTIGTKTVDATGNINATMVTHTATTILPSVRYINGTVLDSVTKAGIAGVTVSGNTSTSTTTNATGFYSLPPVSEGTYALTARMEPTYYMNSSVTVSTIGSAVVVQDIELVKKPTGTITGSVINI